VSTRLRIRRPKRPISRCQTAFRTRTNNDGSADQYQYDALGNLVHVTTRNETAIGYLVDALNRRIVKNKNGTIVARCVYRNGLSPSAVLDGSGALLARFVYAMRPNTPDLMVLANGSIRIHQRSTRAGLVKL
jgi:YD repeat-containing protein